MPEKTCSTCQCNKVCDHNKYGFENCGNYISADVVPRAEVAREIFREIKNKRMFVRDLVGNTRAVVLFDDIVELKKKYTEEGK